MKIIVDAMGGDFAPLAPVKGALMAQEKYGVDIVLTGKTEEILKALQQCGCKELPKGMEIANATEVVEICDDPATAFKHKKDSSLTVGLNMLHAGDADGFVSAGSTGALLAGATLLVKRIRGLRRAASRTTAKTVLGGTHRLRRERRVHGRIPAAICVSWQLLRAESARRRKSAHRSFEHRRGGEQGRHAAPRNVSEAQGSGRGGASQLHRQH